MPFSYMYYEELGLEHYIWEPAIKTIILSFILPQHFLHSYKPFKINQLETVLASLLPFSNA